MHLNAYDFLGLSVYLDNLSVSVSMLSLPAMAMIRAVKFSYVLSEIS